MGKILTSVGIAIFVNLGIVTMLTRLDTEMKILVLGCNIAHVSNKFNLVYKYN